MKTVPTLLAALVLVLGAHAVTTGEPPQPPPAAVPKWDYKLLDPAGREDLYVTEAAFGALGKAGWELVLVERSGRFWFKRPAP